MVRVLRNLVSARSLFHRQTSVIIVNVALGRMLPTQFGRASNSADCQATRALSRVPVRTDFGSATFCGDEKRADREKIRTTSKARMGIYSATKKGRNLDIANPKVFKITHLGGESHCWLAERRATRAPVSSRRPEPLLCSLHGRCDAGTILSSRSSSVPARSDRRAFRVLISGAMRTAPSPLYVC